MSIEIYEGMDPRDKRHILMLRSAIMQAIKGNSVAVILRGYDAAIIAAKDSMEIIEALAMTQVARLYRLHLKIEVIGGGRIIFRSTDDCVQRLGGMRVTDLLVDEFAEIKHRDFEILSARAERCKDSKKSA